MEHLIQELGEERADIFTTPQGSQNSSEETLSGCDAPRSAEAWSGGYRARDVTGIVGFIFCRDPALTVLGYWRETLFAD